MILKSRQIGATWYFAQEALLRALETEVTHPWQRHQIFLSASRRHAYQFKNTIQKAAQAVDVDLKGGGSHHPLKRGRAAFSGDVGGDGTVVYGQLLF